MEKHARSGWLSSNAHSSSFSFRTLMKGRSSRESVASFSFQFLIPKKKLILSAELQNYSLCTWEELLQLAGEGSKFAVHENRIIWLKIISLHNDSYSREFICWWILHGKANFVLSTTFLCFKTAFGRFLVAGRRFIPPSRVTSSIRWEI